MHFLSRLFALSLLLFVLAPPLQAQSRGCQALFLKYADVEITQFELDTIFANLFKQSSIYKCDYCHLNVLRLVKQFQERLPDLDINELRFLYITHKNWRRSEDTDIGFHVLRPRSRYRNGTIPRFQFWNFHVVVEYKGRIYDLDYSDNPTPIAIKDYVDSFFVRDSEAGRYPFWLAGPMNDLVVYSIPALAYLSFPIADMTLWPFHAHIFKTYTPTPLNEYTDIH